MPKRNMNDIFSTPRQTPTTEPVLPNTSIPASQNTGKVKSTWYVETNTVVTLKKIAAEQLSRSGKRVSEGSLIDEAIELLRTKYEL